MSGFLMVHHAGLDVCDSPGDTAALLWLVRRGSRRGWAQPFEATNAQLCVASGLKPGWVRGFLRRMVEAEVIVIAEPGSRRVPRCIAVVDPRPKEVIQARNQEANQEANQNSNEQSTDTGESDSSEIQAGNQGGRSLREKNKKEKKKEKEEQLSLAPARGPVEQLVEHYRSHWPRRLTDGKPYPEMKTLLKGTTIEDAKLLVDWDACCPSGVALHNRTGKHKMAVFRASHTVSYLEEAREWHEAGRPTSQQASTSGADRIRQRREARQADNGQVIDAEGTWHP